MKKNKKYGLFYKSRGKWTGPYAGIETSKLNITNYSNLVKNVLKSKILFREVN
jgi:hypothetical protein